MKKARRTSPRHLQISLSFTPEDFGLGSINLKKAPQKNLKTSPKKVTNKFSTKGRTQQTHQNDKQSGIIRLVSKRKNLRKAEDKQNIEQARQKTEQVNRNEANAKNSLNKYFQSTRAMKSVQLHRVNVESFTVEDCGKDGRLKTEDKGRGKEDAGYESRFQRIVLKEGTVRGVANSRDDRRKLSESKSMKSFLERRQSRGGRSCSLNKQLTQADPEKKLQRRLERLKEYKFIQDYLSDLELEGIFNELQMANVPQVRWPLIVVDKVYQIIRRRESNDYSGDFIRKF